MSIETLFAPEETALSVAELSLQIKRLLEVDPILCDVAVQGEISNFKAHGSGHYYFSLKDDEAQVRCAVWRSSVAGLRFRPKDGDRVVAVGNVEYYAARGEVSLIVRELSFAGQGAQWEAFERTKAELEAEGLFDPARKKPLPPLPLRIGLITSSTGAVLHDVVNVLGRRWPLATIVLVPAAVQGFSAAPDLMRALAWAEAAGDLDLVIVARGGGSAEDLWCFNDEELARMAAEYSVPLISAVGHETDFTILDFVADQRAPTPSAAAELAAPDIRQIYAFVQGARLRLHKSVAGDVKLARQRLEYLRGHRVLRAPKENLAELRARVSQLRLRARDAALRRVKIERQALERRQAELRALDPRRVLERGYAMVRRENGELITNVSQVQNGERLVLLLLGGEVEVVVENVKKTKE